MNGPEQNGRQMTRIRVGLWKTEGFAIDLRWSWSLSGPFCLKTPLGKSMQGHSRAPSATERHTTAAISLRSCNSNSISALKLCAFPPPFSSTMHRSVLWVARFFFLPATTVLFTPLRENDHTGFKGPWSFRSLSLKQHDLCSHGFWPRAFKMGFLEHVLLLVLSPSCN